jgi:hypothetical protein
MTPDELLETVVDRDSFIAFVHALADERERTAQMERDDPARYGYGGALGWENGDISSFLYAALAYFEPGVYHQPEEAPSWRMFAEFLYFGKVYE